MKSKFNMGLEEIHRQSEIFGDTLQIFGNRYFLSHDQIFLNCSEIETYLISDNIDLLKKSFPKSFVSNAITRWEKNFKPATSKREDDDSSWRESLANEEKPVRIGRRIDRYTGEVPAPGKFSSSERIHVLEPLFCRDELNYISENKDALNVIKRLAAEAPVSPVSFFDKALEHRFLDLYSHLATFHPCMSDVSEYLVDELLLSAHQNKPSPRPILMVGPPGVGKTYFAHDLALQLRAPFVSMSLATADTPWVLTGTNSTWTKAKPSLLIQEIARTNSKTGVLFIDEISSAPKDHMRIHPILPTLLELLDSEQSCRFRDLFFDHQMDLGPWVKILACNSLDGVDRAIIDRCQVIEVKRPTADQQLQVIEIMAGKLPVDFSIDALIELNRSTRSLRQVQADLRKLAAKAIRAGVDRVELLDAKRLGIAQEFRP